LGAERGHVAAAIERDLLLNAVALDHVLQGGGICDAGSRGIGLPDRALELRLGGRDARRGERRITRLSGLRVALKLRARELAGRLQRPRRTRAGAGDRRPDVLLAGVGIVLTHRHLAGTGAQGLGLGEGRAELVLHARFARPLECRIILGRNFCETAEEPALLLADRLQLPAETLRDVLPAGRPDQQDRAGQATERHTDTLSRHSA